MCAASLKLGLAAYIDALALWRKAWNFGGLVWSAFS